MAPALAWRFIVQRWSVSLCSSRTGHLAYPRNQDSMVCLHHGVLDWSIAGVNRCSCLIDTRKSEICSLARMPVLDGGAFLGSTKPF